MDKENKIPYKIFARSLYQIIFDERKEVIVLTHLLDRTNYRSINNIDEDHFQWECFCLVMFLSTYNIQRALNHFDKENVKIFLDAFHDQLNTDNSFSDKEVSVLIRDLTRKYEGYHKAIAEDSNAHNELNRIPLNSLVNTFLKNLLDLPADVFPLVGIMVMTELHTYITEYLTHGFDSITQMIQNQAIEF